MQWIKRIDKMPDDEIDVVIINRHGELIAGAVNGQYIEAADGTGIHLDEILLWIPLPPLPTE
ncbi:hypothetical protein [Rosenbergiella epipactidis]|uniref:hypothetical protein n=1 Tax=Rosenbergiella epipactidis TaxID=1544694 RepID=UPI001F4DD8E0|nr:hypothetical protein [Rosenbergiella epipactidis]